MTLADVTRAGVLAAVAEFDRLGRDRFLRSTGFARSRAYYLQHDGRLYDSKAIVGYAHGISAGTPLRPGDFSGGDKTVAHRLEALGFTVRYMPYLDWTRDEIILACELVEANGWKQLDASDERVTALSELLQSRRFTRSTGGIQTSAIRPGSPARPRTSPPFTPLTVVRQATATGWTSRYLMTSWPTRPGCTRWLPVSASC